MRLPVCSSASFPGQARRVLVEEDHPELPAMAEPVFAAFDRVIGRSASANYPEAGRLRQIPGVGPITSLGFVLGIGDPERFSRSRDVGAYLGLVPRRDQSGDRDKQMPISKAGNRCLRRLLVQGARYMPGRFGPECELRTHGRKIAARGGKAAKKRAVIAVARKLSVLMLTPWKQQRDYEPFHRQAQAA